MARRTGPVDDGTPFKYRRYQDCPDAVKRHSELPPDMNSNGYSPTRKQQRCPTCGFWVVWEKRVPKPGSYAAILAGRAAGDHKTGEPQP